MITRAEIKAAVRRMEGNKDAPPSPEVNEFNEPVDPREATRRWIYAVCKFYMEDMPISRIAQHSNCGEALVERVLEASLDKYLEYLEDRDG